MNCRDAAQAISQSLDEPLPALLRLGLVTHTVLCGSCRRFRAQLTQLHAECTLSIEWLHENIRLSEAARERIAAAIERPRR